jgi:hypothetical protein
LSASTPTAAEPGLGRLGPAYLSPIESGRESWPSTSISAVTAFVRTTDELNIVEVARELGKANEAPGVRFAEIKTHEEKRVFVNPATVTYLQDFGEDEGSVDFGWDLDRRASLPGCAKRRPT